MPYVESTVRDHYAGAIAALAGRFNPPSLAYRQPGHLNYVLTRLVAEVYELDQPSYDKINAAIGVLECVKQELYRRVAAPYEDRKKKENGDAF